MKHFKYLLFAFIAITFSFCLSSCGSDDDENEIVTKYTVKLNDQGSNSIVNVNLTIFEYNELGEKIGSQVWDKAEAGVSREFIANPMCVKVKIYIKLSAGSSSSSSWVQQVYYLKQGGSTNITIEGSTKTGSKEP